jgi:hypothetical protein
MQEHGGLRDLGGFFQDQEEHHEVPRRYGRLRSVVKSLCRYFTSLRVTGWRLRQV